jgi:3-oxoacyl-[acyl-carrier protein] reductase
MIGKEEEKMEKNIVITGGSRGIGACLVEGLAKQGNNVIFTYNQSEDKAKNLENKLKEEGYEVEAYQLDMASIEDIHSFVQYVLNKFQKVDVLINNAGIAQEKVFTEVTRTRLGRYDKY